MAGCIYLLHHLVIDSPTIGEIAKTMKISVDEATQGAECMEAFVESRIERQEDSIRKAYRVWELEIANKEQRGREVDEDM